MSFLSLPGMMKKGHFKSSLRHSWIEWSRNGCIIFENVFVFLPLTTHFYGKIVQKIQHSMRVSTFHRSIYAPNGTFSQPESTTGARRDCDARSCFDARTISDARGLSGARGKELLYWWWSIIYIYIYIHPLFQIFTQSLDAIDVTIVTLSHLNSINAIDVTRCWGYLRDIFGIFLGCLWDIFGISWGYL